MVRGFMRAAPPDGKVETFAATALKARDGVSDDKARSLGGRCSRDGDDSSGA